MPRPKGSLGKEVKDPIYTQARWGAKKNEEEPPSVRSGGRIKKAKTIFDPSDSTISKDSPQVKPTERDPDRKSVAGTTTPVAEKRRLSSGTNSSQVSTISARTSVSTVIVHPAAQIQPTPIPSAPSSNGAAKKRKLEIIPCATMAKDKNTPDINSTVIVTSSQGPAKSHVSVQMVKPKTSKESPRIINGKLPFSSNKSISLLKSKNTPAKSDLNTKSHSTASPPIQVSAVALAKRKMLTYQCCKCTKFDALEADQWLKCNGCLVNVHKTCAGPPGLSPWMCRKCTICTDCEEELVVEDEACCNKCFSMYHIECLEPNQAPEQGGTRDWICEYCKVTQKKKRTSQAPVVEREPNEGFAVTVERKSTATPAAAAAKANITATANKESSEVNEKKTIKGVTITQKPAATTGGGGGGDVKTNIPSRGRPKATPTVAKTEAYDPLGGAKVPDASQWTAEDVYQYFVGRFPKEAMIMQEQEIDGVSLLLMRRSDVIQGLGFKLGPALRIYKQIIMLQTRDTDPTLTWY